MKQLYIGNKNYSSWSLRPWLLISELKIPFEEVLKPFSSTSNWQEFRKFSPSGTVPCLIENSITVWDSLAICEYLSEDHPEVWPKHKHARAWARSATAEMHSGFTALRNNCPMNCRLRVELNNISQELQKDLDRLDELWTQGLQEFKGPFLAGEAFTAVDAFFAPVAFRVQTYDLKLSKRSQEYCQNLLNLNSMKQWYNAALIEPWIEPEHEKEIQTVGTVTQDFREKA